MKKYCGTCKQTKSLNEFFRDKAKRDGRCSNCKSCQTKAQRIRGHKKEHKYFGNEAFEKMYVQQQGLCAICKKEISTGRLTPRHMIACLDHCHSTGRIRGLLCPKCNLGLGYFNDDCTLLEMATKYLQK